MIDWADIVSIGVKMAPAAGIVLLGLWMIWLVWRIFRRLIQAFGKRAQTPEAEPVVHRGLERREPTLEPSTSSSDPLANASDILVLKASIDALTRQIAELNRNLSSTGESRLPSKPPSPVVARKEGVSISVEPFNPPTPLKVDQSRALTAKTS